MPTTPQNPDHELTQQPLISHLLELRNRLLKSFLAIGLIFLPMIPYSQEIYTLFAKPLIDLLPNNTSMLAIDITSPFFTPFKLIMVLAFFVAIPFILHQVWSFVAPGLYAHEKRLVVPLLVSSTLLFYLGAAFAYFLVLPIILAFMQTFTPTGVSMAPDITRYLDFVLTLFFAFGVAFEVPVITILSVWAGITTPQTLIEKRPYVIVAAFVIGMLLTPPDVFSQTLLAIPMWMLFEVGVVFSRFYVQGEPETANTPDKQPATANPSQQARKATFANTAQSPAEKLALAKRYLEQHDYASAKVMLQEVLTEGTPSEQAFAKALLDAL